MSEPAPGLYERPTLISHLTGHQRIFAQGAYKAVRDLQFAPVACEEGFGMARFYPLCWRRSGGAPVLGVLRSLLPGGLGHPADVPTQESALPLLLQCFPIILPDAEAIARQQLHFDDVIADRPSDVGAPLLMADGHLSRAALIRARRAVGLAHALNDSAALSRDIDAAGLLEPWTLDFEIGDGRRVRIDDLQVVSAARLHHPELAEIIAAHGAMAGLCLSLHRASLFRVNALLQAARRQAAALPDSGPGEALAS
ncbi:hypothetical protein ASG72_08540 [Bosea sp. Leaf344]|uniref:SapC family protein n=1 Tax=Bosea sp. Leaf344 TaxID=1736346 RepID=UPI0006FCE473|nr:SapC family protein [Bosea sp. Leaf344]KQU51577.1 hypothetical protein ASG72_08540 [Bosea sp. Leaf344]